VHEREPGKIAPVEERRDIDHVASSPSLESKPRAVPLGLRSYAAHMDEDEDEIQMPLAGENRDVVLEETARPSRVDMIDEGDDSDSPKRKRDAEESVPEFKRYGRDKSALRKRRRGRRESRRKGDNRSSSDSDESVNRKAKKKKESKKKHSRHDSGRRREKKEKRSRRSGSSD